MNSSDVSNIIKRELPSTHKRILLNGEQLTLENSDPYFDALPSRHFIRIREDEYPFLPGVGHTYTHFNLSPAFHIPGLTYMFPIILETGYFDGEKEVLPLISLDNAYIVECIGFETFRAYKDLKDEDFKFSASNIHDAEDLKKIIIKKYSKSMPTLSEEEILAKGVSITTLKIVGVFSDNFGYAASTPIESK